MKYIYQALKKLSDLESEGLTLEDVHQPFPSDFREGDVNEHLKQVQYHINFISYFYSEIPKVKIDGVFDEETKQAVLALQKLFGLEQDGIIGRETWINIENAYEAILLTLPAEIDKKKAAFFPNYYLIKGMEDSNVTLLQTYLLKLLETHSWWSKLEVTGIFDDQTVDVVMALQRDYGLEVTGIVGPLTWRQIALLYNGL